MFSAERWNCCSKTLTTLNSPFCLWFSAVFVFTSTLGQTERIKYIFPEGEVKLFFQCDLKQISKKIFKLLNC